VRPFTLVMAYYMNPRMLATHLEHWRTLPPEIQQALHVRIIDDGSPCEDAAEHVCLGVSGLASFELYAMQQDVPWCQDACRNIGVKHTDTQWLLLTDMDHLVPRGTWERLMGGQLDPSTVYRFGRITAPEMTPYKPHPNSWAMTTRMFDAIGGYDERLCGLYGTDGHFLTGVKRTAAALTQLPEVLIRVPREMIPDASTTTLERKKPEDKARIREICAVRNVDPNWRPRRDTFAYERVL